MNTFRADLHCHTTCSDGSFSPEEIVRHAKQLGLSALSITDHDTIKAYATATPLCQELGLELLTGVEFSTTLEGTSIHILGYGFSSEDKGISDFCDRHIKRREERNHAILNLLNKHNMPIDSETLIQPSRSIGRPHIAQAMVDKGYVDSIQTAFRKYLGENRPCYAPGTPFSTQETIDIIHAAKGIAVIAHPHLIADQDILHLLLKMNFDGIECYYGNFTADKHQRWLNLAKKKEWVVTGGSDFHGSIKPNTTLGSSWVDQETYQAILKALSHKSPQTLD